MQLFVFLMQFVCVAKVEEIEKSQRHREEKKKKTPTDRFFYRGL